MQSKAWLLVGMCGACFASASAANAPSVSATRLASAVSNAACYVSTHPKAIANYRYLLKKEVDAVTQGGSPVTTLVARQTPQPNKVYQDPRTQKNLLSMLQPLARLTLKKAVQQQLFSSPPTVWVSDANNRFPDCVAILGHTDQLCSGVLIGKNAVLTALHCHCEGIDRQITVHPKIESDTGKAISVVRTYVLSNCSIPEAPDIAVLELATPVASGSSTRLAAPAMIESTTWVMAVGFGLTDYHATDSYGTRRFARIPITSHACNEFTRGPDGPIVDSDRYGCLFGEELVAASPGSPDTCSGDSGGPIYVLSDGMYYLAGLTSRGVIYSVEPCGDGGIYERLDGPKVRKALEKLARQHESLHIDFEELTSVGR